MKTLTITFSTTPGVPVPNPEMTGPGVGIRLTITRPDGTTASPPVADTLVWTIGNFVEGQVYKLLAEVVDAEGRSIQALPVIDLNVPAIATYNRLDTYTLAWN